MKKRGFILGVLAIACSVTAFAGCDSEEQKREVYSVHGQYNQLAYEMESYRVCSAKSINGKRKQTTREITIPLETIQYYFCDDTRQYITEENNNEFVQEQALTKEIVGEEVANDLGLGSSYASNYSSVYKEYFYIEIDYKLIEEKKIEIEEKDASYVITYYKIHQKDKAKLKENEKPYEWIKYVSRYPKEGIIINYRAEIIQP